VAARTREIGTLRALGFSRFSILLSFLIESVFLALVGAALGCLIAVLTNGMTAATGGPNFSQMAFAFRVTSNSLLAGFAFAGAMGIVGGILPALRASRMPIASALKEA
jgi:putative ABC transport system permease protein